MNKNEQAQLCMLLAKMRYDIMETMTHQNLDEDYFNKCDDLLSAINRILSYSYIDYNNCNIK